MDATDSNPTAAIAVARTRNVPTLAVLLWYVALSIYGTSVIFSLRDFVPIWDGWAFYQECFMMAALTGDCTCHEHTAYLPTAVYGAIAYAFPYNMTVFALFNFAFGLSACYFLGRSLSNFHQSSQWLCHAATSILMLNPVMFAHTIQPSLDYMLAALTAYLLAAFLAGDLVIATLIGLLMTSTKETGVMLYGVLLIGYMLVSLAELARANGFKSALGYALRHSYTVSPLFLFLFYSTVFGLHGRSFGKSTLSLADVAERLLAISPDTDLFISQMASLFVLNFSWIITIGAVAGIALLLARPKTLPRQSVKWLAIIGVALILGCYFHTRVLLWNNPRYVLPLYVYLLTGFVISMSWLYTKYPRCTTISLILYLPLLVASQFFTIDPLSKVAFQTFPFGEHSMLSLGGIRRLPMQGGMAYIGRDQLVYNLQFVKFSDLAEQAVREFGLDTIFVTGPRFTGWSDFRRYDQNRLSRSMRPNARQIAFYPIRRSVDELRQGGKPFVYLRFPNVVNDEIVRQLKRNFKLLAVRTLSSSGYSIDAYDFGAAITSSSIGSVPSLPVAK